MNAIYESVRCRFAGSVVHVRRATSERAVNEFPDAYFDWVYVDGDHQYEAVNKDLELYLPKVKPGGFITGDDYGNPGWWQDGVTRAVNEFIAHHSCKTIVIGNHQFLIQL